MKRLKISALLIIAALSIAAVGSAALSSLNFDREVSAGQILVDTNENVAIQITNVSHYDDLVKTNPNGEVSLNLNAAINNNMNNGFNTDAQFSIGTSENGVIKIKNNSDISVNVNLTDADGISLSPVRGSGNTIGVGEAVDFYFTIDTNGKNAMDNLNAILHIEEE